MKKMKHGAQKFSIAICLTVASVCAYTPVLLGQEQELIEIISHHEHSLEASIARDLTLKLQSLLGGEVFWLDLDIKIDTRKFLARYDLGNKSGSAAKLPGLNVATSEASIGRAQALPDKQMLRFINVITATVIIREDAEKSLQKVVRDLVRKHLTEKTLVKTVKVEVLLRSLPKPLIAADTSGQVTEKRQDDRIPELLQGLLKRVDQVLSALSFSGLSNLKSHPVAIAVVVSCAATVLTTLILLFWISRSIKRASAEIARSVSESAGLQPAGAHPALVAPIARGRDVLNPSSSSPEGGGYDALEKLKIVLPANAAVLSELTTQLIRAGMYDHVMVLLGCVDDMERQRLLAGHSPRVLQRLKIQMRINGTRLMSEDGRLAALAEDLIGLVWMVNQDSQILGFHFLAQRLAAQPDAKLARLLQDASDGERSLAAEVIPPNRLAALITQRLIAMDLFQNIDKHADEPSSIKTLEERLWQLEESETDSAMVQGDIKKNIAAHLTQSDEEEFYRQLGIDPDDSIAKLARTHFDVLMGWISKLSLIEQSDLLAAFDDATRQAVLSRLPDLKAKRIAAHGFALKPQSLLLKARLSDVLRAAQDSSINKGGGHVQAA